MPSRGGKHRNAGEMTEHEILVDAGADLDRAMPTPGELGVDEAFSTDIAQRARNAVRRVGPALVRDEPDLAGTGLHRGIAIEIR